MRVNRRPRSPKLYRLRRTSTIFKVSWLDMFDTFNVFNYNYRYRVVNSRVPVHIVAVAPGR